MDELTSDPPKTVLPILATPAGYVCPGEDHPIPRSIHLARLAAYYPKCRECDHRHDTGQLPKSTVGRLDLTAARVVQPSPFGLEGVRGEYLNHLTRQIAARVAAAVADYCWQSHPLAGRLPVLDDDFDGPTCAPAQSRPVVVMGHDARPSSPDLCVGVSASLRRMGCEVLDVGRVTGPCHSFAVEHLQADAGLFVTGSGTPPQGTGLDLIGPRGVPWSLARSGTSGPATLDDVERRFLAGVSRPTRQGGTQRYFDAAVPYRASLLKHFRDLRPLRIVCATDDGMLSRTLQTVFDPLPCDLIPLPANPRPASGGRKPPDTTPAPTHSKPFRTAIRESDAACGIAINEDGRGITVFDEAGRPAPLADLFVRLINERRGSRRLQVCLLEDADEQFEVVRSSVSTAVSISGGREALARRLFDPTAGFGIEPDGRLWIKDAVPTCDAVLTLGLLLQTLSQRREPLSTLLGGR